MTPSSSSAERFRAQLTGFGPVGVLSTVIIVLTGNLIGPALILAWAVTTRTPWRDLGFARPRSWWLMAPLGIVLGIALRYLIKLAMPLLGFYPSNMYQYLRGNTAALPGMIFMVVVGAGFGEETVWRGFLFQRFRRLMGSGVWARRAILLITSVAFGFAHLHDQGWRGVAQSSMTGLVFGGLYLGTGNIFLPMIVHAVFDLAAVVLIYYGRY